jgi:hypothetical protein
MPLRKSKARSSKEAVTDRTDDLMAALEAAKEALARASAAAGRKGAELGKEASKAADKLLPERARQRRRAARRRRFRLLAGVAGLVGAGVVASRLAGSKAQELRQTLKRQGDGSGGSWDRGPESAPQTDPGSGAEVTQLHQGNGATTNPARTPPT